ncbi:MAG: prepilin-type N-terminal cleavage/methylation domain-containing protein [Verrucomicrobia bacterium]|nr:prepilin-type N-terminal cleavage/methylation domain-containing protein [Verrucomicrobiota bacterium]
MSEPFPTRVGFTLVELLVCVAVIGVLAAILVPALARSMDAAQLTRCRSAMRGLSQGVLLWASDHEGELPRSSHSAFGYQQRGWAKSILPYLGEPDNPDSAMWLAAQKRYFRCPADISRKSGLSYGLNAFFELDPGFDDYQGSPQQWRRLASIPKPTRTILLAEVPAAADHVMAHFWEEGGVGYDVDIDRHDGKSQFAFADGHVELLPIDMTFDPAKGINHWNPSLAR